MSRIWRVIIVTAVVAAGCTPTTHHVPPPTPSPTVATSPSPTPLRVVLPLSGTYSWALAGLETGSPVEGSPNATKTTGTIESVIKVWLAADWLQDHYQASPQDLSSLAEMIGRSDDWLAERRYRELGGDKSVRRMIEMCLLQDTEVYSGYWARTKTSAADLVRLGWCIQDGSAATPRWTSWLLQRMKAPHDAGAFGIVDAVPSALQVAYMNGWTNYGDVWQVNCLAIGPSWVLAVMTSYPAFRGLHHGASVCANVTKQLAVAGRI